MTESDKSDKKVLYRVTLKYYKDENGNPCITEQKAECVESHLGTWPDGVKFDVITPPQGTPIAALCSGRKT